MGHDVFLCYATEDKTIADAVCATLEANRIRCWVAPRDILPGMDYGESILKAINGCRLMVMIFSAKSNGSEHVKNEVERAVNEEKPIIPFRVENVLPSGCLALHLSRRHWLDALTPPLEKHLKRLAETIQLLLSVKEEAGEKVVGPIFTQVEKHSKSFFRRKAIAIGIIFAIICIIAAVFLINRGKKETKLQAGAEENALKTRPVSDLETQLSLASALKEKGKIDESIKEYEKAIALSDSDPRPYKHLAELFENKKELEKSIFYYKKFTEAAPEESNLNLIHQKIKDLEAQRLFLASSQKIIKPPEEKAPKVEPSAKLSQVKVDTPKILNQGIEAFNEEDYDQCIKQMEDVLKLDPDNSSAKYFLAEAKRKKENKLIEEEIRNRIRDSENAYQKGDYRDCIEQAKAVLRLDPNNAQAKKISDSANLKIAPEQINAIIIQYVQSLNNENLLAFYEKNCSSQLYPRMKKETESISKLYRSLKSVASDINIRFEKIHIAEVSFSHIITGVSIQDGKKLVLFEGTVKWDMEKYEDSWLIKSVSSQPRERK